MEDRNSHNVVYVRVTPLMLKPLVRVAPLVLKRLVSVTPLVSIINGKQK